MPLYSLKCNNCNMTKEVICHVPKDKVRRRCPVCGKMMVRDWSKDGIQVKCDHDTTTGDIERNLEKRYANKHVPNNLLARSLARVPGIPKIKARDGKVYAAFRNQKHRREVLKKIGQGDAD